MFTPAITIKKSQKTLEILQGSFWDAVPVPSEDRQSCVVEVAQSATVAELTDYYPYGSSRLDEQNEGYNEQRKFTGQEYDAGTGLYYYNARYQNPTIGKFVSQDQKVVSNPEQFLADPQQMNYYSYGRDNPIINTDPSGNSILGDLGSAFKSFVGNLFQISGANSFTGTGYREPAFNPDVGATQMISAGAVKAAPVITKTASAGIQLSGIAASAACEGVCSQFVLGGTQALANSIQGSGGYNDPSVAAALGIKMYRGGNDMTARPGVDVKVDENGMVSPTRGVTVYSDPSHPNVAGHGTPHEIDTGDLPEGLRYVQQGKDPTHYEIPPSQTMPFEDYQELLNDIPRTPYP